MHFSLTPKTASCTKNNGEITFEIFGGTLPYLISIKTSDNQTYTLSTHNSRDTLTDLPSGFYQAKITDGNNCETETSFTIDSFPLPVISYIVSPETCNQKDGTITVMVTSASPNNLLYEWMGLSDTSNILTDLATGTYTVKVMDSFCEATAIIPVPHIDCPQVNTTLRVYIPNTFSPNGDNLNDTWKPILSEYSAEGYNLTLYDRWGQRIFHTTDPNASWDGTINGKHAQNNTVYSYCLRVRDLGGKEFGYVGVVILCW